MHTAHTSNLQSVLLQNAPFAATVTAEVLTAVLLACSYLRGSSDRVLHLEKQPMQKNWCWLNLAALHLVWQLPNDGSWPELLPALAVTPQKALPLP